MKTVIKRGIHGDKREKTEGERTRRGREGGREGGRENWRAEGEEHTCPQANGPIEAQAAEAVFV